MKSAVLGDPPLVGREHELAELIRNLDLVIKGKGTTVFVSGEAGSGKTRLINEFLDAVKGKEIVVLSSWCLSDVAVPYFPFMEAFNAYFSVKKAVKTENEEAEVKAWLIGSKQFGKLEKLQNLTPQARQDLAFAALTKSLFSIAEEKTVILFIDDLHWADSASLSLLHYISRSIGSARVLALVTYRSEELSPDAEGCPHPLLETLRLMRREGAIKEIKLSNLGQVGVAALAEKMVGGRLHAELAQRLVEESQGNPLFIVESLRMLSEHGNLVQDLGGWRLSTDEVGIPAKIKDIILRRTGMLKANQRRILDLASVIGERFDIDLLVSVLGQDSLEVLETLNAVGQSSSLIFCKGNYYEFDHAKSRETIYGEIAPPLKRGYHARIAEKMEANSKGKDLPVNDLAFHYAQAGNKEKAAEFALAAGEDALARFSNAEAIRYFTYALENIQESTKNIDDRAKALEGLGDAFFVSGIYDKALTKFEELNHVAESDIVKLRALRKAVPCTYWIADQTRELELITKGEGYSHLDPLEYARFLLSRGFVARNLGRTEQEYADITEALKLFEEEYALSDVARGLGEMTFFYLGNEQLQDEIVAGLRSVKLYQDLEDLRGELWARSRLSWAFGHSELFQEAFDNVERGVKIGEKIGDYNLTAILLWRLGILYSTKKDHRAAIDVLLKAMEYAERTNAYVTHKFVRRILVKEYIDIGEIERAEEIAKKLEETPNTKDDFVGDVFVSVLLLVAKGKWDEVDKIYRELLEKIAKDRWGSGMKILMRLEYALALIKQGRIEEAKRQREEALKLGTKVRAELENLDKANVQSFLVTLKEIGVGEKLPVRLDIVNASKKPVMLVKIEGVILPEFKTAELPSYSTLENGIVVMNKKEVGPFNIETLTLSLQANKPGVFILNPCVVYTDDLGATRTCMSRKVAVTVRPMLRTKIGEATISVPILPGRVTTGFADLDALLYGGLPQNYAVVLTSSPTDEREQIIRRFLEAGAISHAATLYMTTEPGIAKTLVKNYPLNFYLFVCNPRTDITLENSTNIFKLRGVENLTEIDIALAKIFRILDTLEPTPKRAFIGIISDVLLQHHSVNTRRWLNALLPTLKAKGFTTLADINPRMHPQEEFEAILSVFDGEIRIFEKETPEGTKQVLKIRKLVNQKYLDKELVLSKEALSDLD